jgi:hypothetical protein
VECTNLKNISRGRKIKITMDQNEENKWGGGKIFEKM